MRTLALVILTSACATTSPSPQSDRLSMGERNDGCTYAPPTGSNIAKKICPPPRDETRFWVAWPVRYREAGNDVEILTVAPHP